MKELGAKWLVDMASCISNNPSFTVNGFICSGITGALDGVVDDSSEPEQEDEQFDPNDELFECGESIEEIFFLGAAAGTSYIVFISTSGMLHSSDIYIDI